MQERPLACAPAQGERQGQVIGALLVGTSLAGCGTARGNLEREILQDDRRPRRGQRDRSRRGRSLGEAIARGSSVGTALGSTSGAPRERALKFLISSRWIVGEAEAQGLSISSAAVEDGLRQKIDAMPNGRREFQEELSSTGQTLADVKLEVKSSLATARLREAVARGVPAVTSAQWQATTLITAGASTSPNDGWTT